MASVPRVRWAQNGVFLRSRSFSGKRNEKFVVTDHKPSQQRIQGHRLIVSAAAKTAGRGRDTDSELSGLDRLILYDRRTCDDWTADIGDVRRKKKSVVDAEAGENSENFDEWMRDSVAEIVSNIGEAPFLFHIHADDDQTGSSSNASVKFVREKAVADSWPLIKERWKKGGSPIPNGVILVEELQNNEIIVSPNEEEEDIINNNQLHYSTTKTWGVLIQAKGVNSTACYILKTCRVETFLGGFCTHFYLVRAKCFVESAETQLKKMWLQR